MEEEKWQRKEKGKERETAKAAGAATAAAATAPPPPPATAGGSKGHGAVRSSVGKRQDVAPINDENLEVAETPCDRCEEANYFCWVYVPKPRGPQRKSCHRCHLLRKSCSLAVVWKMEKKVQRSVKMLEKVHRVTKAAEKKEARVAASKETVEEEVEETEEELPKKNKGKAKTVEHSTVIHICPRQASKMVKEVKDEMKEEVKEEVKEVKVDGSALEWQSTGKFFLITDYRHILTTVLLEGMQAGPSSGVVRQRRMRASDVSEIYAQLRSMEESTRVRFDELRQDMGQIESNADMMKRFFREQLAEVQRHSNETLDHTRSYENQVGLLSQQTAALHSSLSAIHNQSSQLTGCLATMMDQWMNQRQGDGTINSSQL